MTLRRHKDSLDIFCWCVLGMAGCLLISVICDFYSSLERMLSP